jgi:hypothetical protein
MRPIAATLDSPVLQQAERFRAVAMCNDKAEALLS